jgi:PTH1 family peptidyl-tRNA hydrolase
MPRLIVLLGNPGRQYEKTRHNCARRLEAFIPGADTLSWRKKFHGRYTLLSLPAQSRERIYLLKPETYMNKSGLSVQAAAAFFSLQTEEIIVVHDDIEQEFGAVRIRRGGGLAGHNGLRSIAEALGSRNFKRLSIGIGRPRHGSVSSFVLGRFTPEEEARLPAVLQGAAEELLRLITAQ